eukprot:CAMPEP_0182582466 /NCGR_PEP_ID=MMETSP1324-20130603/52671_1 /TAXON_ID=236786 /ORGANISM="Florenciella sp., Strain RCC1587" /LENGTH=112 /DNA_ID=CAMNT_0024798935 /DNA_START=60 /DNA_END=394 /DNA_ORIENTATION=+
MIDYTCRLLSFLAGSNRVRPHIKDQIIATGIATELLQLAAVPASAPAPYCNWAVRALQTLSNLCDDTYDECHRAQLSLKMNQVGAVGPLMLHCTADDSTAVERALDGLHTLT